MLKGAPRTPVPSAARPAMAAVPGKVANPADACAINQLSSNMALPDRSGIVQCLWNIVHLALPRERPFQPYLTVAQHGGVEPSLGRRRYGAAKDAIELRPVEGDQ